MKDLLLPAKQHYFFFFFFCYVAGIVEPFFKKYQTDIPIIPFLYFDLKAVIRNFEIVIEPVVIEDCHSGRPFKEIDFSEKRGIYYRHRKSTLSLLLRKKLIPLQSLMSSRIQQINKFRESARDFVVEVLYKLFERSSLGSTLLRCASVFDPTCFLDMIQEKLQIRWKGLLKCVSPFLF